jgi:hypothetical protein
MTAAVPTSPGPPSTPAGVLAHTLPGAFWHAATSSPWGIALMALAALTFVARVVRVLVVGSIAKDTARTFSRSQKDLLLARAGYQCEHHGFLFGRCKEETKLEADHVHPHSRGGWTRVENGQILCRQHNRLKRANVPWNFELRAIEKQRLAYYPTEVSGAVVRRAPRVKAGDKQSFRRVPFDRT